MAALSSGYLMQRAAWSARQLMRVALRRFGMMGVVCVVIVAVLFLSLVLLTMQSRHIAQLKAPSVVVDHPKASVLTGALGMASELSDFQHYLLDYGDIPDTLRDLIVLGQANNLVLSRGEYQAQVDSRGKFLRYQMTLPVRGEAQAVERFILETLAQHKTMALESVQFKREGRSSNDLEAKVQWVLLTRLQADTGGTP